MNISKQMLRVAVAVMATAFCGKLLADPALEFELDNENPFQESFESYAVNTLATSFTYWESTSEDDISAVTNDITYTLEGSTQQPISGDHAKVLKLNTEGGTLSAVFEPASASFLKDPIYIDTVVNFVISEDDPSFGESDAKIAIFANATSNLVVRHGFYLDGALVVTNSVTDVKIDPEKWYRLTISTRYAEDATIYDYLAWYKIVLNGDPENDVVTHVNAFEEDSKKVWFASALENNADSYNALAAVSFQGTGYIDDLVVTRADPFDTGNLGNYYMVYVDVVGDGAAKTNGYSLSTPAEIKVLSDNPKLTITFEANEWNRIHSVTQDNSVVVGFAGQKSKDLELEDIEDSMNVVAVFEKASAAQVGSTNGVDITWLADKYASESDALADSHHHDYYALNVTPSETFNIALSIGAIVVDGNNVKVTCVLKDGDDPLSTTLKGCLTVYGKAKLDAEDWALIGTDAIEDKAQFNANGEKVVTFDVGENNFFRAVISVEKPVYTP